MDIHAPEGPTRSLREFAIHILIVTIGILIALALEGLREIVHEHRQIRETRELLHKELDENRHRLVNERVATQKGLERLSKLLDSYGELSRRPEALDREVQAVEPASYFFTSLTWDTALSTGVLGHMSADEVTRQAAVSISVKTYSGFQAQTFEQWNRALAFFKARPGALTAADAVTGRERLEELRMDYQVLTHLQMEFEGADERAAK